MLLDYFGLIEEPFGVTPDPRFLHLGPKHREALASLVYATETNRGFVALTGQPGMGKTSLLFHYLESLRTRHRTAFIFQKATNARDLMHYLLHDLGLDASGESLPEMHAALNKLLAGEMRAGRRLVLVIDEAQTLNEEVLESIRLLSNFETPWMKLVQIVLCGQPQLAEQLAQSSMVQLLQRISYLIRLEPLNAAETKAYINHRLWVAGYQHPSLFTEEALSLIAERSAGIPRNINNLCFHGMSLACALKKKEIDDAVIHEVLSDLTIQRCPTAQPQSTQRFGAVLISNNSKQKTPDFARPALSAPVSSRIRKLPLAVSLALAAFLLTGLGVARKTPQLLRHLTMTPNVQAAILSNAKLPSIPIASVPSNGTEPLARTALVSSEPARVQTGTDLRSFTVLVPEGATLRDLSLLYLTKFDRGTLDEIRRLNPALAELPRIDAGQLLRLPEPTQEAQRPSGIAKAQDRVTASEAQP
jgi:type II secretory pathway predicted ATPase ExeA